MPATCNGRHKQRAKAEASGLVKIHGKHRQPKLKTALAAAQKAVGPLFPTFSIGYLTVNTRQVPAYSVRSLTGSGGGGGGGINGIYDLTDILDREMRTVKNISDPLKVRCRGSGQWRIQDF